MKLRKKFFKKINKKFHNFISRSLYGFTKLASEELIKEFNYSNNLTYIINRIGVISGPWQFGKVDQGSLAIGAGLI